MGSGATIQAYAGICGSENLQINSDAYFHAGSLDEMTTFVSGGGIFGNGDVCAAKTATPTSAPITTSLATSSLRPPPVVIRFCR